MHNDHSGLIQHIRTLYIVHYPLYINSLMFKQFISKIPGADTYMVASFLIFLVFFALVGLYLIFADKKHLNHLSQLPLEDQ